jgi:hypothetical protein
VKGGRLVGGFALRRGQRAQEKQRLGDDALLASAVGAAPRDVQRAELADRDAGVAEPGEQLLALPLVGPGQRHQVLHRGLRRHGPGAHALLRRGGERIEEPEPARHPALRAAQPARLLVERQPIIAQPTEQPRVLERGAPGDREVAMVHERLDLGQRPCRRHHRVAMQAVQRVDAQVAVDQHVSLVIADDDHRHLLPELGDRADHPPALLAVMDAQIAMPELELVQVHVHAATLHQHASRAEAGA